MLALPELFSTGYLDDPSSLSETDSGETIKTLSDLSAQYDIAICGSYVAQIDNVYYNRAFFLKPNGEKYFSNKRHLFILGGEDKTYGRGSERLIVEYQGFKIALFVCFDLRFPVWCRNVAQECYDIAIFVANWPKARVEQWDTLLQARAIENQAYVCGVNICGLEPTSLEYNGHSAIYDYKGRKITSDIDGEGIVEYDLNLRKLIGYRNGFPALECQDCFTLNI